MHVRSSPTNLTSKGLRRGDAIMLFSPSGIRVVHPHFTRKGPRWRKNLDAERIGGLLKRALELGHYDILEHNSITWLAEADEKEILFSWNIEILREKPDR